ncbi:MAG TPA: serine protease [Ilumatobacter sp.]
MKRSRWIATALVVSVTACADGPPRRIATVAVAATPCDRPNARLGVGTVVADGLVLTAAHVVEDDLRDVEVDGRPARVVALDARTDAAVLELEQPIQHGAVMVDDIVVAGAVRIVMPGDVIETTVQRIVTLSVDDATDGVVHRRDALVLDGVVPAGTSGAPVVDGEGRVVGMVTISHAGRGVAYATRTRELLPLVDSVRATGPVSVTRSSLAARRPCA